MDIKEIAEFEKQVAELFRQKKIRVPIHLSGGNLGKLAEIFEEIRQDDYVFSTHRNHAHYLLHTGNKEFLLNNILSGNDMGSMHTIDRKHNFFATAIVAGGVAIATGVALALKLNKSDRKVWCFIGDGATDEGWFWEAYRYASSQDLPIKFIIEDNNRSVCTTSVQRWGDEQGNKATLYTYECKYPHAGIGEYIAL